MKYAHIEVKVVPDEVSAGGWVSWQELKDQVQKALRNSSFKHATEAESLKLKGEKLKKMTRSVEVELKIAGQNRSQKMLIHYWGVRMMMNAKLSKFVSQE